jgi:hypothetical protein
MMSLSLDEALSVLPHLPPLLRSGLSIETFSHPGALEALVVEACRRWSELYVSLDGTFVEAPGHDISPETSGQRFGEALQSNPRLARTASSYLKERHPVAEIESLVVRAAYATGRVLDIGLREVPMIDASSDEIIAGEPDPID